MAKLKRIWKRHLFILTTIILASGLCLAPHVAKAASTDVYYVATHGDDTDPGSETQPWRTIQKAADTMTAGDSVIVLSGEYDERVQITTSGSSGAPITYQAEGTVTMKGFTVRADHITIQGFDITDTDNHWSEGWGIFVEGSYCYIEGNYIYYATRGGIRIWASQGNYANTSHCIVRGNRLYRNATAGIEVYGRYNLVEGNEIWRTIQYHPKWENPPSTVDADGMRFFGSGHTIKGNYIHDIRLDDPENINPHIDCFQTWSSPGYEAGHDIIFEQNYCENLNQGMYAFMLKGASTLTIRNNIIQAFGGVNTGAGGNSHLTIVNNVIASDLSFLNPVGIGLENCPNTVVKNNIFYDQPYHTISVTGNRSGQEIDYNLAYRSDGQPSWCYKIDYECVDPAPIHDIWDVDPLFISPISADFHLQQSSPAIDTGKVLVEVTNDFDDVPRPQGAGYDIGAFEYTTVGPTATIAPSSTPVPPSPTLESSPTALPPTSTQVSSPTPTPTNIPTLTSTLTSTPFITPTSTRTLTPSETPSSTPLPSDINQDGQVDVLDTQLCVNVVLGTETDPVTVARADVNTDGEVNVLDVQEIVNIMLAI